MIVYVFSRAVTVYFLKAHKENWNKKLIYYCTTIVVAKYDTVFDKL